MFGRKGLKRIEEVPSDPLADSQPEESDGFSLEELGQAYSTAIQQSGLQLVDQPEPDPPASEQVDPSFETGTVTDEVLLDAPVADESDGVPLRPDSILEAVLFLGTAQNQAIGIQKLVDLFRNLSSDEIDQCVDDLNQTYRDDQRAFEIVKEGSGYRMQLASELNIVRDRFYSKQKETQLNQSAIDCLSLVAYQPGITREKLEHQWNQPAASMLSMLVRKGLIRIEKSDTQPTENRYYTTDRFLEIIGLGSLDDLPHTEDI